MLLSIGGAFFMRGFTLMYLQHMLVQGWGKGEGHRWGERERVEGGEGGRVEG